MRTTDFGSNPWFQGNMHSEVLIHQGLLAIRDLLQLFSNTKGSLVDILIGKPLHCYGDCEKQR